MDYQAANAIHPMTKVLQMILFMMTFMYGVKVWLGGDQAHI